jgi:putative membrane protein
MRRKAFRSVVCGVLAFSLAFATPITSSAKVTKQESVYVIANPDGSTKSITVSDQLQGAAGESGTIKDVSDLSDIKNVKGDETFDQNGQNLTWNLNGADIFYQGKTDKSLPVSVKLIYELDGAKVNPQDIVGESGKLKITVKYENNCIESKTVDGKSVEIARPFLMVTGRVLDGEQLKDVKIDD